MPHIPDTFKKLLSYGATIEINGSDMLPNTLYDLADQAIRNGGHLVINGEDYVPAILLELARRGGRSITIRFS